MITKRPEGYTPAPVGKFFSYDWQYAAGLARSTAAILTPVLLLLLAAIIDVEKLGVLAIPRLLLFALIVFLDALLCVVFFCPQVIREYRDYGQYQARVHSHRWIVWLVHNNLKSLSEWKRIVHDAISKGVAVDFEHFREGDIKAALANIMSTATGSDTRTKYKPENFNRDVYLPIELEGQKVILFLEEDDPKLAQKEKELFWILFTEAAKERTYARVLFYILFILSVVLGSASIFLTIAKLPLK